MKKTTKKLSFTTETVRYLQADELAHVAGGSYSLVGVSGTNVMTISSGTSVISRNPSGGMPSGH